MADIWYDVDAALSEVPINIAPLTDDTDFKSREVSLTYNQAGLDLVWNFVTTAGAFTQTAVTPTDTAGAYDWVNQGKGYYTIEIPASGGATINNDTEGFGWFTGYATGVLPWRGPIIGFRAAALNNALIDGGDNLDVNMIEISGDSTAADNLESYCDGTTPIPANATQLSGDATAADNAEAFFDGTGYAGTNNVIPTVTTVTNLHASAATAAELAKVPKSDSNVSWNATALGAIQSECTDALSAYDPPTNAEMEARTLVAADYTIVSDLPVAPDNASIAAILLDTGTDGVLLSAGAVDAIHDEVVEGTTTFRQAMRLAMSALFGKVSGAPTGPIVFRDIGDTKTRISATVDADGNRTAVTKDAT